MIRPSGGSRRVASTWRHVRRPVAAASRHLGRGRGQRGGARRRRHPHLLGDCQPGGCLLGSTIPRHYIRYVCRYVGRHSEWHQIGVAHSDGDEVAGGVGGLGN